MPSKTEQISKTKAKNAAAANELDAFEQGAWGRKFPTVVRRGAGPGTA